MIAKYGYEDMCFVSSAFIFVSIFVRGFENDPCRFHPHQTSEVMFIALAGIMVFQNFCNLWIVLTWLCWTQTQAKLNPDSKNTYPVPGYTGQVSPFHARYWTSEDKVWDSACEFPAGISEDGLSGDHPDVRLDEGGVKQAGR